MEGIAEMCINKIRDILVNRGKDWFNREPEFFQYTGNKEADTLLNDLQNHPHAFVLACIMDRQMPAEQAWLVPHLLRQRLNGDFSTVRLSALTENKIIQLMTTPKPLHRFPNMMARNLYSAIQKIKSVYNSDASRIWADQPSSALVIYRFLDFKGVGLKIASMAANILAREHKVRFSDYYSVDISADTHVNRVFKRLQLVPPRASVEHVIYRARSLYPEFPGLMDYPCWEIGRNWCKPKKTHCKSCYLAKVCPSHVI